MDKLYAIKIRQSDGTYGDEIPINVLAQNVNWDSSHTLVDILGVVDTSNSIQNQITSLLNTKATQASVNLLATKVNNIIANAGNDNTEIVDARAGVDGTIYFLLKTRLDTEYTQLKNTIDGIKNWIGYPTNLFDARQLTISNTKNWSIDSATKTSVTITHKTTYSTGNPNVILDLPSGDYIFSANYTNLETPFSLSSDGSWVKALTDGTEFTIDSTKTNKIYFSNSIIGTYTITDISIVVKEQNGKIQTIEDDIDQLSATTGVLSAEVDDLKDGFADISKPVIDKLTGKETVNQTIKRNGSPIAAGANTYRVLKFPVTAGKTYWLTASANYRSLLWCFYDNDDNIIQLGTETANDVTFTSVTDQEVIAPKGATYIRITYNTTIKQGVCKTQTGYMLDGQWKGKKWVCIGDSLTAENSKTAKHYFDYVAEETGITTINMGDSGSGYAREQDVGTAFYQRIQNCPTDADVVTIFGSFNDLDTGLPIGSVDDTGTDTLAGCINTTIDNLQAIIPLVNLGIVAPTPWDTTQPSTSGQAFNYVEMLKAICERRSIPFLDLWRESNLRPWNADFRALAYSKDDGGGTHPDENGHKIIAPRFKSFLETLLF